MSKGKQEGDKPSAADAGGRRPRTRRPESPLTRKSWGYDPMLGLESIRTTMNEMLSELFAKKGTWGADLPWEPAVDLYEEGDNLVVEVVLPGVHKRDLQIHGTRDLLILSGDSRRPQDVPGDRFHVQERRFGHFSRSVPLPFEVDPERIKAELKDGILVIVLPSLGQRTKTYNIPIE